MSRPGGRAPLFFVDRLPPARATASLSAEDSRHALRALRLRDGDEVMLSDGRGMVGTGRLRGEDVGRATVAVAEVRAADRRPPAVTVVMAAPKGDRLSWAVQKLAEVGVDEVALVRAGRSVRVWEPERLARAEARLRAVAREAAMQSRQPFVMEVGSLPDLAAALAAGAGRAILLDPTASAGLAEALPEGPAAVRLVIGPEGGWTAAELEAAKAAGAAVGSLGAPILRTETAALVAATIALSRYGRLG